MIRAAGRTLQAQLYLWAQAALPADQALRARLERAA